MVTFSGIGSIALRDPKLGNKRTLHLKTTIHRAMSGRLWAYASRAATISLSLQFGNENRPKILTLINFLRTNAGQFITYTDHLGTVWTGKILTNPFDETHIGRVNNEFNLEFEGTHT